MCTFHTAHPNPLPLTSCTPYLTGESGAGKTETTKKAMQYFATLAGGTGALGSQVSVGVYRCGDVFLCVVA